MVSEKSKLKVLYVNDLGPRSRNDLDLQYSHMFLISVGFRSQAANVLKNQQFSLFPIEKPKLPKFDPAVIIGQGQPRVII